MIISADGRCVGSRVSVDSYAHKCTIEAHEEKIDDSKNNDFPAYSCQELSGDMSAIGPFICYDEEGTLGCAESRKKDQQSWIMTAATCGIQGQDNMRKVTI